MPLSTRKKVLLAKIESSEGVDASPVAGSDAILCSNPRISFSPNVITTDEVSGSLDPDAPLVGGMTAQISFDVFLKGSGTAGTAPEFGKLLKACGWAETVTGTAVPSSAEALGSGASASEATLGSSASSTANAYRGMPINFSSGVSGSAFIQAYSAGKVATLTDTLGGTLTASSNYQIPVNVLYGPASASIPTLTFYLYQDGQLYKLVGARGTMSHNLNSGEPGRLSFNFSAMFLSKTDAALPTPTYADATRPPLFKNAVMKVNRAAVQLQSLSLDCGNTYPHPDNPNALEAFDPAVITARRMTGSINPIATLVATRDALADFRDGTKRIIHARLGATAGNRVGITIPAAQYTGFGEGDRSGFITEELPFEATGRDAGAFLNFY